MIKFDVLEKIKFQDGSFPVWQLRRQDTTHSIFVSYAPFSNCQTFSIASVQNLIRNDEEIKNIIETINEIRKLCNIHKRLCQIDVQKKYYDKIKEYVNVYKSMEYLNLTGSTMVNLLIIL